MMIIYISTGRVVFENSNLQVVSVAEKMIEMKQLLSRTSTIIWYSTLQSASAASHWENMYVQQIYIVSLIVHYDTSVMTST